MLVVLALVLGAVSLWNRWLLTLPPLATEYIFDGPSGVFLGESGRLFVVDTARKDILILNEEREYVRTISGGKTGEDGFYYASAVTDGPGGIYVADALYSGEGTVVEAERILRFETDGSGGEVLFQLDYPNADTAPRQYGRIKCLTLKGERLLFAAVSDHGVTVYSYDLGTGEVERSLYYFGASYVSYTALDPDTERPVIIAGDTTIQTVDETGVVRVLAETGGLPYQLTVTEDGTIWYSDPNTGALMYVSGDGATEVGSDAVYAYYISSSGSAICISDGSNAAVLEEGDIWSATAVPVANQAARNLMWLLLGLCLLCALALAAAAARVIIRGWLAYPFFRSVVAVILVAVVVSAGISWYLLSTTFREENARTMAQLEQMSEEIVAETDVALLKQLSQPTDYKNSTFNTLKGRLDGVINAGYQRGEYFYYLTYITDGAFIYGVMDYEDTVRTGTVYDVYGSAGLTEVFETGEQVLVEGEVSTWGAWTLLLNPVVDETGQVVAIQEVGFNYDNQRLEQRETVLNTVLTIVFGAIVLVMLLIEGIYFLENRKERRERLNHFELQAELCDQLPLRTLTFLAFTVDCMQDAFISVLTTNLYQPFLGIPASVGAALPISAQVLTAAVFAVLGGFLSGRMGNVRVIRLGLILHASGFALCGVTLSYFGILTGKLLVGAGVGLLTVGINATAAASTDAKKQVSLFAGISAGTLVGVSAGSGLGSTILSLAGYRAVFFTGTAIVGLALILTLSGRPEKRDAGRSAPAAAREAGDAGTIGLGQFLFGRGGTLPFLALVLTPFMAAIYFREYFFPIYSAQNGLSETNIGRIYVLCALMVIYAGPAMIRTLTQGLGTMRTVLLTSSVVSLATLSFGILPNMAGALLGVLLVSLAVSCGYAAQSSYYAGLPAVSQLGEGRAMGIYSLFDNSGQTLGPIVYGGAMLLGYQTGMLCVGGVLVLLTAAFGVLRHDELKEKTISLPQEEEIC